MPRLDQLLDNLEALHGNQQPSWPLDPYLFLVWWQCGYPASDAACRKGWESLTKRIGTDPDRLLSANPAKLALALKPGGMVPELRAMRLKEIAERVQKEFGGELLAGLSGMPISQARASLKKFPGIADPGADRILLFGGISPVAAVPSNCPYVLVRIEQGQERENYVQNYREAQHLIAAAFPARSTGGSMADAPDREAFHPRIRAYLLLKCHGQTLCKRTNPKCSACPVSNSCAFFAGKMRGRPAPDRRQS
jgi:endonuclease III